MEGTFNPFSGLGGDVMTSFDNETKTDGQTKIRGARENTASGVLKKELIHYLLPIFMNVDSHVPKLVALVEF